MWLQLQQRQQHFAWILSPLSQGPYAAAAAEPAAAADLALVYDATAMQDQHQYGPLAYPTHVHVAAEAYLIAYSAAVSVMLPAAVLLLQQVASWAADCLCCYSCWYYLQPEH
jgi:hypothetical protein